MSCPFLWLNKYEKRMTVGKLQTIDGEGLFFKRGSLRVKEFR